MKSALKIFASAMLLSALVGCGEVEEEIVYDPSPYDLPSEYKLSDSDTAPVFFADVFSYIESNVVPVEESTAEETEVQVELSKEEEKALEEEEKRLEAAQELLAKELERENNKLGSIQLVAVHDPTESNNELLAEALLEYEELKASVVPAPTVSSEEESTPEGEVTEEQLSNEGEVSLEPTVDSAPVEETQQATVTTGLVDEATYLQAVELAPYVYNYDISTTGYTGGQATANYVDTMLSSRFKIIDAFHPVNDEYYEMLTPDFTQRAGTVTMAKMASGTARLMFVTVDWNYYGATVTVEYRDGTLWVAPVVKATSGTLSIADAVAFLETRNPADLGLSGNSMTDYNVYTSEGLVMINGVSYRQFTVSGRATDGNGATYGGTYLINAEGLTFSVNQVTGAVTPLNIVNVYDTMG